MKVNLDGYDPARRIGFEFITTEAGDRAEFTDGVVAMLERRMAMGELYLLLIDEHEALTPEALRFAASGFLSRLREQRKLR